MDGSSPEAWNQNARVLEPPWGAGAHWWAEACLVGPLWIFKGGTLRPSTRPRGTQGKPEAVQGALHCKYLSDGRGSIKGRRVLEQPAAKPAARRRRVPRQCPSEPPPREPVPPEGAAESMLPRETSDLANSEAS